MVGFREKGIYFIAWMDGVTAVMNYLNTLEADSVSKRELYKYLMNLRPYDGR